LHHVMFDIDGTLVETSTIDNELFASAVHEVIGVDIDTNWLNYKHVTDTGILYEVFERNGLLEREADILRAVKSSFVDKITVKLEKSPAREVPGAISFINHLNSLDDVAVSFATGGWGDVSALKLRSAGFTVSDDAISSSNDHFIRTEIMKLARAKFPAIPDHARTYFGDGAWDKRACEELGINFVLVGKNTTHYQNISDFNSIYEAMTFIGL